MSIKYEFNEKTAKENICGSIFANFSTNRITVLVFYLNNLTTTGTVPRQTVE